VRPRGDGSQALGRDLAFLVLDHNVGGPVAPIRIGPATSDDTIEAIGWGIDETPPSKLGGASPTAVGVHATRPQYDGHEPRDCHLLDRPCYYDVGYLRADEPWRVTLVDTGQETMTGGRLRRVADHLDDETFCMTYGDGVADVRISDLIDFHKRHEVLATLTAVQPPGRFGALTLRDSDERITSFLEKPTNGDGGDEAWVNGGFFVLEPGAIDYIDGDATVWEREPLERLARERQLAAYRHRGFWQPMDTLRDKHLLEDLWDRGEAPWAVL
jgi:glucose-1-phosphate cytidylyltransferase